MCTGAELVARLLLYLLSSHAKNIIPTMSIRPKGIPIPRPTPKAKELGLEELGIILDVVGVVLEELVLDGEEVVKLVT